MEKIRPDIYQKDFSLIPFDKLSQRGIKVILLDLDNTVLRYKKKEIERDYFLKIKELNNDFTFIIFSNAMPKKVKEMAGQLGVDYTSVALKPCIKNYKKVLSKYKVTPSQVAIIGDQMLTDITGGNKVGITTVLVDPLGREESIFTKINRIREKKRIKKLSKKGLFYKERYYE